MMFKNFNEVIKYIDNFTNLEKSTDHYTTRTYRLDRMKAILEQAGNPQLSYRIIHLAGSKGKGSTAAFIAHGLKAIGEKTGLYMSPHVNDYRERFTLCGEFFPDKILVETGNELKSCIEGFHFSEDLGENSPTVFELYTTFAFLLFRNAGCTWAVLETGLGGRLDATNVVIPQASVICPIELEHTDILGNTIPLIAREKAKIIKPGIPAFISLQKPQAIPVFKKEAELNNSKIFFLENELESFSSTTTSKGEQLKFKLRNYKEISLNLKMLGTVQAYNSILAILVLKKLGLYVEGKTETGIESTTLPARMERIEYQGRNFYLDGAHTALSVRYLIKTFRAISNNEKPTLIFGAVSGKDHKSMCCELLTYFQQIVISKPGTFKKSSPENLYRLFRKYSDPEQKIKLIEDAKLAIEEAIKITEDGDSILVCGSFYLAGEIEKAMNKGETING